MDRKDIFTSITGRYNQSIISPVNPFTVDNPDALVYNGHSLIGLFIPWIKELKNPDLLLRRLFFTRLSLSKTVSNVLLLIGEESRNLLNNGQINAAFDNVFVYERMEDLLHFLSDNIQPRVYIHPKLKRDRMKRFWGNMEFIERNGIEKHHFAYQDGLGKYEVRSWSEPNKTHISRNATYLHPNLMAQKRASKQSFLEGFEGLMTYTAMFNYTMIDGVLKTNPIATDSFMFLNIEDIDTITQNPMSIRTLAFLGYVPGRIGEDYDIQGLRRRYMDFMDENRYL